MQGIKFCINERLQQQICIIELYDVYVASYLKTLPHIQTKLSLLLLDTQSYMDIAISTINKQSSYTQSDNANRDLKTVSFTYLLATQRFPQNWSHYLIGSFHIKSTKNFFYPFGFSQNLVCRQHWMRKCKIKILALWVTSFCDCGHLKNIFSYFRRCLPYLKAHSSTSFLDNGIKIYQLGALLILFHMMQFFWFIMKVKVKINCR